MVLVFALSIGLSWYQFGFLDLGITWQMGLMLLPVLGAAAFVLLRAGEPLKREAIGRISKVKETLPIEMYSVVRRKAEAAKPVVEAVEGDSFYIITTLLGIVMLLLAGLDFFIMSQTMLLR